jgi:alkaline phosphatase D
MRTRPRERRAPAFTRRDFLRSASAGLALVASGCRLPLGPRMSFASDPFSLGVASGSPLPDSVVLWTRLAPSPLQPGGGLSPEPISLRFWIAEDEGFSRGVRKGTAQALPELAHSVHVEVPGLAPDRVYWYRFECGDAQSPVGRTRTAPAPGAARERFRFAYGSCQNWETGYFSAYRHMLADDLDLVVFLGDYFYESPASDRGVRRHEGPEPETLDAYRARHALYKTDPDLRAAHAAYPWVVTWDDHEVENDYAADFAQDRSDPAKFHARRAAAYQAYYEHMPLRAGALPKDGAMRLYQNLRFGDLLELHVLDTRQYRSDQACSDQGFGLGGGQLVQDCAQRLAPGQVMMGPEQEAWLQRGLASSKARWNVLAQQLLMAGLEQKAGPGEAYWSDGWDGYAAERTRLLEFVAERRIPNLVAIGGDIHSFWATELRANFRDPSSPVLASEFVGTSVTSNPPPYETFVKFLPENPQIKFFESRSRGYVRCEVRPERWTTDFRALDAVTAPQSTASTLASFVVESGRPGPVRA